MTKQSTKRQNAAQSKPTAYKASSSSASSSSSRAQKTIPPPPFKPAPPTLAPFLQYLDPAKCYILHVDRLSPAFKRQIFAVPVALNVAIVILLAWRAYVAVPHYLDMLLLVLGVPTRAVVDKSDKTTSDLVGITVRRALMIMGDFLLCRVLGSWAYLFFVGEDECSPALWRWRVWFREEEIVVRVSRRWGAGEFWESLGKAGGVVVGMQNALVRDKVLPAVDAEWMRERTGYMMIGKEWDLDFEGMCRAQGVVESGEMDVTEFEKCVVVHGGDRLGWYVWRVEGEASSGSTTTTTTGESEEDARRRIGLFKDKLTKLGKESLFFRWIELIQYYSSQPGGFTPERQTESVGKAREMFERQGIDFDEFMKEVGGAGNFPGLDQGNATR